uniref:POLO box domain-containing protein n=1 Tax=Strongyloides venezuelensis TaxID=75913 RepID=A0A0K0G280_STRVS
MSIPLKWRKDDKPISFLLFNDVIQVNFLEDYTKDIFSLPTQSVLIIVKDNNQKKLLAQKVSFEGMG